MKDTNSLFEQAQCCTFKMELQVPYCICPQISETSYIWTNQSGYREDIETTM